ncbi:unnamed protein product, partial [Effrenium voratum]
NGQFELHNYEPAPLKKLSSRTTSVDLKELHCWARLDVDSNEYQQTMSSGPPWSRVYFRRTIDAKTGEIINQEEAPQPEMDIQLPQAMTIITELWHLPQPHECYFVGYEDGIIPMEAGWDGGPETTSPIESSTFFDVYATKLATSENDTTTTINDDSDVDLENMAYGESPAAQLTRQQAKALEKELPVSQIMTMPENNIHEFVKAAVKEADSWDRWHCIRPVPPAEAERIQRDPQLRKRIITARCCYRDKAKGKPPLKAKARMVAHGHLDPDIRSLSRNAATPTRISEMLLLAIYISGLHGMAFRTADQWMLWAGDATTAFLQGAQDVTERAGRLFMKPKQDEILRRAKAFQNSLYEIVGNVYGLCNAPVTWAKEVTRRLLELGFIRHSFDHMCFYFPDLSKDGSFAPCAILICYVDDFLLTYNPRFPFDKFFQKFEWGSHGHLEPDKPFIFKGKQINLVDYKNGRAVHINQPDLIATTTSGKIKRGQNLDELLRPEDFSEFRSAAGCIQWIAGQCRPDVSAWVSLASRGEETTYKELNMLYDTISHLQDTKDLGLIIPPVPIDSSTTVLAYSDASWANAMNQASQHGCIIGLAANTITEVKQLCSATDRVAFTSLSLAEFINGENVSLTDKRSMVNIRSIQEEITPRTVHWIPTTLMAADGVIFMVIWVLCNTQNDVMDLTTKTLVVGDTFWKASFFAFSSLGVVTLLSASIGANDKDWVGDFWQIENLRLPLCKVVFGLNIKSWQASGFILKPLGLYVLGGFLFVTQILLEESIHSGMQLLEMDQDEVEHKFCFFVEQIDYQTAARARSFPKEKQGSYFSNSSDLQVLERLSKLSSLESLVACNVSRRCKLEHQQIPNITERHNKDFLDYIHAVWGSWVRRSPPSDCYGASDIWPVPAFNIPKKNFQLAEVKQKEPPNFRYAAAYVGADNWLPWDHKMLFTDSVKTACHYVCVQWAEETTVTKLLELGMVVGGGMAIVMGADIIGGYLGNRLIDRDTKPNDLAAVILFDTRVLWHALPGMWACICSCCYRWRFKGPNEDDDKKRRKYSWLAFVSVVSLGLKFLGAVYLVGWQYRTLVVQYSESMADRGLLRCLLYLGLFNTVLRSMFCFTKIMWTEGEDAGFHEKKRKGSIKVTKVKSFDMYTWLKLPAKQVLTYLFDYTYNLGTEELESDEDLKVEMLSSTVEDCYTIEVGARGVIKKIPNYGATYEGSKVFVTFTSGVKVSGNELAVEGKKKIPIEPSLLAQCPEGTEDDQEFLRAFLNLQDQDPGEGEANCCGQHVSALGSLSHALATGCDQRSGGRVRRVLEPSENSGNPQEHESRAGFNSATAAASCSDGAGLHTARSPEGGSMAWQALCKICAEHLLPRARLDAVRRLGQALARLGSEPVQEPRSPRSPSHQGEVMAAKSEGMARLQMTESSGPSAFRKPAVHRGKTLPNLTSMIRRDPAFAAAENAKAAESEDEIAEVEDL